MKSMTFNYHLCFNSVQKVNDHLKGSESQNVYCSYCLNKNPPVSLAVFPCTGKYKKNICSCPNLCFLSSYFCCQASHRLSSPSFSVCFFFLVPQQWTDRQRCCFSLHSSPSCPYCPHCPDYHFPATENW